MRALSPRAVAKFITYSPQTVFTLSQPPPSVTLGLMSTKPATTIRALHPDDRGEWGEMWCDYLAFYQTSVPPEVYDTTFARMLGDERRDFCALVAQQDGRLVGLTHYLFHRHAWKVEDVCYLQDLYTRPETRGSGAGRALIEAVYKAADANGVATVYWLTQDFNETARRLYDRVGVQTPFIKYQRP